MTETKTHLNEAALVLLSKTTETLASVSPDAISAGTACAALEAVRSVLHAGGRPISGRTRQAVLSLIAAVKEDLTLA